MSSPASWPRGDKPHPPVQRLQPLRGTAGTACLEAGPASTSRRKECAGRPSASFFYRSTARAPAGSTNLSTSTTTAWPSADVLQRPSAGAPKATQATAAPLVPLFAADHQTIVLQFPAHAPPSVRMGSVVFPAEQAVVPAAQPRRDHRPWTGSPSRPMASGIRADAPPPGTLDGCGSPAAGTTTPEGREQQQYEDTTLQSYSAAEMGGSRPDPDR